MKALTVCQPHAHRIWLGEKPIENRNWPTKYRGLLLIHAGKSRDWMDEGDEQRYPGMRFGAIIAAAQLVGTPELDRPSDWREEWRHLITHDDANGPFCWILEGVRKIKPVPCRGAQGLWVPPPINLQYGGFCVSCGCDIEGMEPNLCGECSCEDDSAIW